MGLRFLTALSALLIFAYSDPLATADRGDELRERRAQAAGRRHCRDGRDNDRDGLIDYPADSGCKNRRDRSERGRQRPSPTPTAAPLPGQGELGPGAGLGGLRPFPDDTPWNTDISGAPLDPDSDAYIASIGLDTSLRPDFGTVWDGAPNGIPYVVVSGSQEQVPVSFDYESESDAGPYPVPPDAPIEGGTDGGGDRHVIVVDRDNWVLYELYDAHFTGPGWRAGSGAVFYLASNMLRPAGWTSADAAGLPIFPGLVRYDETVEQGEIRHALRFTASRTRRAYAYPARHFASSSSDPRLPPMGLRVRLKASVEIAGFPPAVQVILRALKKYGMFLADNGSDWFVSGAPDPRWDDEELAALRRIKGRDFEAVQLGQVTEG